MNNQTNIHSFEPEIIQSKPLTDKEQQKLSQIITEAKANKQKKAHHH